MQKRFGFSVLVMMTAALATSGARAQDAAVKQELVPTGKLRVAIAVGPALSAIYTIKDETSGKYRGVTIDLSTELAKKLGVPIEFVPYRGSGENPKDRRQAACGMSRSCRSIRSARNSSISAMPITCCRARTS